MPTMPFHLEKGHALMALEDLFNNPSHRAALSAVWDGLRNNLPVGEVFKTATASAPLLDNYGDNPIVTTRGGLGSFVSGAWFGDPASSTGSYWLDYTGEVGEIVRQALLLAVEVADPRVTRRDPLPDGPFDRRIELLWHCGQRWFEAWLTWEEDTAAVSVLFATPPHAFGPVTPVVAAAGKKGTRPRPVDAATVNRARDMVLVSQPRHKPRRTMTFWPTAPGTIPLPSIGLAYTGQGGVQAWSIHADSGGVNPPTPFA